MSTPSTESSGENPRKRMRKGTHSCLECRRRKIRCIYEPNVSVCNRCLSKKLACTGQVYGDAKALGVDKRKSMKERTGELESMIGQILQKLENNGSGNIANAGLQSSEMTAAEALRCLRTELLPTTTLGADVLQQPPSTLQSLNLDSSPESNRGLHHFPLLSLFDNAVVSSKASDDHDENGVISTDKNRRVLSALRALIPNASDLGYILQSSQQSWRMWQGTQPGCSEIKLEHLSDKQLQDIKGEVYQALLSDDVGLVAKTLAVLAVSIQQLPREFDFSRLSLPESPEALQDHYVTSVETLLSSDDGLASTVNGLQCMIILTKFYVNVGKPRKSWLITRRAICIAQMLGFHRQMNSSFSKDRANQRPDYIWVQLFQMERYLCLFLGYPTAVQDTHFDEDIVNDRDCDGLIGERFVLKMSVIVGQIIERNQNPKDMTIATTLKIDQDVEDLRKEMAPKSWWESDATPNMPFEEVYDLVLTKLFYHNIRMYIHLPFMLKSATDRRYEFSRIAALESSREIMEHYMILRNPSRPLLAVCNVIDFQAFTASMILVINLLGDATAGSHSSSTQEDEDWKLIERLTATLHQIAGQESGHGEGSVAAQAVRLLEGFRKARNGYRSCEYSYQAVIPYFGKIRIRWGKAVRQPSQSSASATTPNLSHFPGTQMPTPPDTIGTPFALSSADPQVSFDSFFPPLPGEGGNQCWPDNAAPAGDSWPSMNGIELLDDWGWYDNAEQRGPGNSMGVL
ncbi:MAG: hypothetical protein Q9214_005186 [Letrouitia sp. 1 TL-2023]